MLDFFLEILLLLFYKKISICSTLAVLLLDLKFSLGLSVTCVIAVRPIHQNLYLNMVTLGLLQFRISL